MGYRSQVVLAVDKALMGKFLAHVSQCESTKNLVFAQADDKVENYEGDGNFLFRWDSVKWYDGYKEVDCISNFMDEVDDMELDAITVSSPAGGPDHERKVMGEECYRFIRVGEENGDIEERGEGFEIYPQTTISY
tara:strand:+ start:38 stop:442 length:405 start_codon:yes stop_codon:yes gene_type:complete